MIIDLFCGGGGTTCGLEMAGFPVDVAVNHSPLAVKIHRRNHPHTKHFVQDVWAVSPTEATQGRPVTLLWASAACTHFSRAKGRATDLSAKVRDLASVVTERWIPELGERAPRIIILENVEEFTTWGPLVDGAPDRERQGESFAAFVRKLKELGYAVQWKTLRACDYGVPTSRVRLFLVARRDGEPIVWPTPTHGAPDSLLVRGGYLKPWRTAAECIDWSLPCPSIFATSAEVMAEHGIRAVRPLADKTLRRIAQGVAKFVLGRAEPFLVSYHSSDAFRGSGLDEPLPTADTSNRFGLVRPLLAPIDARMEHGRAQGVYAFLSTYYGTGVGSSVISPMPTLTTRDRLGLVTVKVKGEELALADIGLRMLTPRELATAMGFPETYVLDEDEDGEPVSRSVQVSCIGNAVCPPLAGALAKANLPPLRKN